MTDKMIDRNCCRKAQIGVQTIGKVPQLIVSLLLIFGPGVRSIPAQVDQGTITGVISDSTGAAIPKASIDVLNVGTGQKLHTNADANGVYTLPPLIVGTYDVTASANGFASSTMHFVQVRVDQRLSLNLMLKVGASSQSVEVSATDVPLLQTQDASDAQVLSSETINNTPLNGRNYTFIAQLTPGVAPATSAGSRGQATGDFDANGQRPEQNNYILDGIDNNSTSADLLNSTSYSIKPPPDALSEFRIQTISYDAQLGHSSELSSTQQSRPAPIPSTAIYGNISETAHSMPVSSMLRAFLRITRISLAQRLGDQSFGTICSSSEMPRQTGSSRATRSFCPSRHH